MDKAEPDGATRIRVAAETYARMFAVDGLDYNRLLAAYVAGVFAGIKEAGRINNGVFNAISSK